MGIKTENLYFHQIVEILRQADVTIAFLTSSVIFIGVLIIAAQKEVFFILKPIGFIHRKLYEKISRIFEYLQDYKRHSKILFKAVGLSLVMSFFNILAFYIIALSIGCTIELSYFLFFIPIINLVSSIPISYGGLGVREGMFVILFSQVGMADSQALGIPLIFLGLRITVALTCGVIYFFLQPK